MVSFVACFAYFSKGRTTLELVFLFATTVKVLIILLFGHVVLSFLVASSFLLAIMWYAWGYL